MTSETRADRPRPRVLVLADDLIWSDRLGRAVAAAGAVPTAIRDDQRFDAELSSAPAGAIIDLSTRAYDGIDAVRRTVAAGIPALAVGQHDDIELRKLALDAGADRVLAYQKMADDGPAAIAAFLARTSGARA
jgi:DNA-binding response OmpR family regulator